MKWARTTVVFCLRRFVPSLGEPEFTIENDVRHGPKHCPRFWPARPRVVTRRRQQLLQPRPRCADLNRASACRRSELKGCRAFGPRPVDVLTLGRLHAERRDVVVHHGFVDRLHRVDLGRPTATRHCRGPPLSVGSRCHLQPYRDTSGRLRGPCRRVRRCPRADAHAVQLPRR